MKFHSLRTKILASCILWIIIYIIIMLAAYGACQLYDRKSRLALIENQRKEIVQLETKITFLENNDWALAVQQLSEIEQDELAALNEQLKQKKEKNNANR